MLPEQLPRNVPQAQLIMVHVERAHAPGIDPGPDDMGMPPPVLLMEDDGARLPRKAQLALDLGDGLVKLVYSDLRMLRRVEAHGEQMILAARPSRDGLQFRERPPQILRHEAAQIVQFHMVVVAHRQQVAGQLRRVAAL